MPSTFNAQDAAIVVSSCDAYSDLWPIFFHFFFKHWDSPALPVYLISNHRYYKDSRVIPICVGEDKSWSDNIIKGLKSIKEENLFVWLDDFLVDSEIQSSAMTACIEQLDQAGGKYLAVDQHGDLGEAMENTSLRRIEKGNLRAGLNLSLWKKAFLNQILVPSCSIWAAESRLRKLNTEGEPGLFYMKDESPKVVSYVESVKGQFWKPQAIKFLREQGIKVNLKRRPFPPQGNDFISKFFRSCYKRRMKALSAREARAALKGEGLEVLPLQAAS
ncbi:MAG: hypothetical protein K9N47_14725 [Prosthecobacter sp.]|uniref:hypothetical protein n=1 Tax=Prosthecobacter sp. TaxID=1965333 RepID=UPI0025F3626C|nr:hypothetical protein [Prosthecobacter sp.]MCF7787380.1 hypothetical protein [Prosthecobacter sp.]